MSNRQLADTHNAYHDPYGERNGDTDARATASDNPFQEDSGVGEHRPDGPPEAMLEAYGASPGYPKTRNGAAAAGGGLRKKHWIIGALALAAVIVAAVVGGVVGSRKHNDKSKNDVDKSSSSSFDIGDNAASDDGSEPGSNTNNQTPAFAPPPAPVEGETLGRTGSTVTQADGKTFIYTNNHGGYWVSTPFDDSAKAQAYTPALNESWDFTNGKMFGVNLGGWLVTEPFISPALYEPYENDDPPAYSEYDLMQRWGDNATARIQEHYDTFIVEEDFALIAAAGLNWVRIPLPHWAIDTVEGEVFVEGLAWQYFLKAITWCRKYGLRINLDLHTAPGSQNGWNHSGRLAGVGWLNGVMGIVNAQRTLNHIRTLAEFISQPQYKNVVAMFSILNEPNIDITGEDQTRSFYFQAYNAVRLASGTGEGKGPFIALDRGFQSFQSYTGFLVGADRVALDYHTYFAFDPPSAQSAAAAAAIPCQYWGKNFNDTRQSFGLTLSGEWSVAINDCSEYLNGIGQGSRYDGTFVVNGEPAFERTGSCDDWNDPTTWSDEVKQGLQRVAYAHMDALPNWYFWTWKIGESLKTPGKAPNPMWHLKLAIQQGYFPSDLQKYVGTCNSIRASQGQPPFPASGAFHSYPSPWMTGGAGAGNIAAEQTASYGHWPPTSFHGTIGAQATLLPTYVPTGTPVTLAVPTPTPTGADPGSGWANSADSAGWLVPKSGCSYLAPYSGLNVPVPTAAC